MNNQKLFEYMLNEHNVTLQETDMQEIRNIVLEQIEEQPTGDWVLAICKETYPHEPDMRKYADNKICVEEVRIFHKGETDFVRDGFYNKDFWQVVEPKVYKRKTEEQ